MELKTISILGCGWFGFAFAEALIANGFDVKGSTTSADRLEKLQACGIEPYLINLNEDTELPADFFETDVLLINIPPRAKTENPLQYPDKMKRILQAAKKVQQVIFIGSTGVFEDGNFELDESVTPKPNNEAGRALLAAENVFQTSGLNTTIIRFAGLIGPGRNLAKFFAGRKDIPNGQAPINLIALEDCIGLCLQLLESQSFGGIYHAVSPHHPSREAFYTELCKVSDMAKPSFKNELLEWKQISSTGKLDYNYQVRNWFEWMEGPQTW